MLYKNEEDFNCINNDDNFLKKVEKLINNSILKPKQICKNILESDNDTSFSNCLVLDAIDSFEKKKIQSKSQEKNQKKNPIYDVNINDIIGLKSKINNVEIENVGNIKSRDEIKNVNQLYECSKENIKG